MKGIHHHLLDITEPMTVYTGADFARDAKKTIEEILERNKLPIVTGGTFFYTELLREVKQFAPVPPNQNLRIELEKLSTEELFTKLKASDPDRAGNIDQYNRPRLIRALEIIKTLGKVPNLKNNSSPYEWLTYGIEIEKETLHKRIKLRLEQRLENGMVEEVERLLTEGVTKERLEELGLEYRYLAKYLFKEITFEEMFTEILNKSKQFAKRQYTWLKADKTIVWKQFPINTDELEAETRKFLEI